MDLQQLVTQAKQAASLAYAPYSGFQVGAVVVTQGGRTFSGANVENAAFGSTLCAEAVAIGSAVAAGSPKLLVIAVASATGVPSPPCGNCRQIMSEFGVKQIVLEGDAGDVKVYELEAMLPEAFGPAELRGVSLTD